MGKLILWNVFLCHVGIFVKSVWWSTDQTIANRRHDGFVSIVSVCSKILWNHWFLSVSIESTAMFDQFEKYHFSDCICTICVYIGCVSDIWGKINIWIWIWVSYIAFHNSCHRDLLIIHLANGKYVQFHWKLWEIHRKQ